MSEWRDKNGDPIDGVLTVEYTMTGVVETYLIRKGKIITPPPQSKESE